MPRPLTIRRAQLTDLDNVATLVRQTVGWLGQQGYDQWQDSGFGNRQRLGRAIERGDVWVVLDGESVIATATLNDDADPEFWRPDDHPKQALYLHRIVVERDRSGERIGTAMLDWAARKAREADRPLLRLDAWASNKELHKYYARNRFENVRTLHLAHRGSGALFERASSIQLGGGPVLLEEPQDRVVTHPV